MRKSVVKRFISAVLICTLTMTSLICPVMADENDQIIISGHEFGDSGISNQDTIKALSEVIEKLCGGDPKSLIPWAADKLFNEIFKDSDIPLDQQNLELLKEIDGKMDEVLVQLSLISQQMHDTSLANYINEFIKYSKEEKVTNTSLSAFGEIDKMEVSSEEKERLRKKY